MANFERGVYEPRDEARGGARDGGAREGGVRVFDGAEDEDDDIEGSRLPLLIVLALLVLAMFGGVVWLAYTQGVARGRSETPVLAAAGGPERVAPPQDGNNSVPYQGFKIYEQPAPSDDGAEAAPPQGPAKPAEVPKQAQAPAPAAPVPEKPAAPVPEKTVAAPPPPKPVPAPVAKAAPPAPKPAPAPKSMAALIQQANSAPEPKPAAKAPAPSAKLAPPAKPVPITSGVATGAPRALGGKQVAAAPVVAPVAPASAGGYVLQIGAYKSQGDAETAWKAYKARHAALLTGYSDDIRQVDLGEKGTWYRLRIGGLSDREVANALCDRLKSDGGACLLSK